MRASYAQNAVACDMFVARHKTTLAHWVKHPSLPNSSAPLSYQILSALCTNAHTHKPAQDGIPGRIVAAQRDQGLGRGARVQRGRGRGREGSVEIYQRVWGKVQNLQWRARQDSGRHHWRVTSNSREFICCMHHSNKTGRHIGRENSHVVNSKGEDEHRCARHKCNLCSK